MEELLENTRGSRNRMEPIAGTSVSKMRKIIRKTVITTKIGENTGRQRGDGPPSDSWSWRKYGQKPIKGSLYPRGYYRCSTAKGCSAKKQVEICRTDASVVIITYTSTHNHPGPDFIHDHSADELHTHNSPKSPTATNESEDFRNSEELHQAPNSPPKCAENSKPQMEIHTQVEKTHDLPTVLFDEDGPLPYPTMMTTSTASIQPSSEENDFFDELEELPISSSFTSLMTGSFFDERLLPLPS